MSYAGDTPAGAAPGAFHRVEASETILVGGTAITADSQLLTGGGKLMYWNINETTGAAAGKIALYDGNNATGQLIGTLNIASGGTDTETFFPEGLRIRRGIFVHSISGSVAFTVGYRFDLPGGGT